MYEYFHISAADLGKDAKVPVLKLGDSGEVFYEIAMEMVNTIKANNAAGKHTVFICPVGPVGQYPIFVRLVNRDRISLKNCWFINMDEYLTDEGEWVEKSHPLSFRGFMDRTVYTKIDPELLMPESQRIFPDPHDPEHIQRVIETLGGVDVAFGGIGINGHLAFNEPQDELTADEFAQLPTRVLTISRETRTTNAIDPPGRLPRLAPGRGASDRLRRGERPLPGHPHPAPSRRDGHRQRQRFAAAVLNKRAGEEKQDGTVRHHKCAGLHRPPLCAP